MSGHNPHGHLSQPNSSWNPLQIPSYIPRQPQLAHMSNERPLVRSPLTWHTPTPPEAIYSFISANHKNLELNPLLPSFVRGPPPFGSVDLTIQSARNSTTPSPRNLASPPPDFVHSKSLPCSVTQSSLSNSISPSPGVIQSTGSVREKYCASNGNNGELPSPGSLFVRDARQINNELVKMTNREPIEDVSEPVELVKDIICQPAKCNVVANSPKRSSPARPPSIAGNTPASPQSENASNSVSNINSSTEHLNNHILSAIPQKASIETINTENSPLCSAIPSPSNTTSNEDSIDSNTSKTRRKRKPNKTVKISNESDESLAGNETETCIPKIEDKKENNDISEKEQFPVECKDTTNIESNKDEQESSSKIEFSEETVKSCEPTNKPISDSIPNTENNSISEESKNLPQNDTLSVIVNNITNRSEVPINESIKSSTTSDENLGSEICNQQSTSPNNLDSPRKRSKRKGDSDDIETIDKIAAMIANVNENTEEIAACTLKDIEQTEAQSGKSETQQNSDNCSKINDLTEILGAPIRSEKQSSQENTDNVKENCFEEVENKLEEMFAGIEDERPIGVDPPALESTTEQTTNEVTCDLDLELPLPEKLENETEQKQQPSAQKRTHSTKLEQIPPKKKRKIVKKPLNNQKCIKSKSKHASRSILQEKSVKEKVKDESFVGDIKYKGPFVQLKPDGSTIVVNAPIADDDVDKLNKVKKSIHNHSNSERNKIRGLHVSTLSTKYDADKADASWMCVFCKKGPHKMGLGDLFGPYIVTTSCEEFDLTQKDSSEDEFVSKRTKADMYRKQIRSMPAMPASTSSANANNTAGTHSLKKKRKHVESPNIVKQQENIASKELLHGMSKVSETSYEVWMHEDCAVWAPGVHIIGARIVGLEAAVWGSTRYKCSICLHNGAVICCLQRGCSEKAHIPCARIQNWTVVENDFKSFCKSHSNSTS